MPQAPHSPAPSALTPAPPSPTPACLQLQGFTYSERRDVLAGLTRAFDNAGCWLLERKALSLTQVSARFELQLRSALELYAGLLAAGVDLTRGSHMVFHGLCTVRKHQLNRLEPFRIVEMELELSFLEDLDVPASLLPQGGNA